MKNEIELNEIRNLTYAKFRAHTSEIQESINYFLLGQDFTIKELYRVINLIIYGVDIDIENNLNMLRSYSKGITCTVQTFCIRQDKPYFAIAMQMEIDETNVIPDLFAEHNVLLHNIEVRIFK